MAAAAMAGEELGVARGGEERGLYTRLGVSVGDDG
jgi:hypothetical protein